MKENLEIKKLKGELFIGKIKTTMFVLILILEIFVIGKFLIENELIEVKKLGDKIGIVHFNQEVSEEYVNKIMEDMDEALETKEYKEILFIMSSPGGSPTASEELSEYLKTLNKTIPITMYVESIAASGGYYIASSIKPLIANKNAIVGSIGVIMPHYNFEEFAKKVGVEENFLAAGKFKKPVSSFKAITEEDKEYLKGNVLMPMYDNFLQSVADNRGLSLKEIKPLAEGIIYLANNEKIKGKLIDEISSLHKIKSDLKSKYEDIKFQNMLKKEPVGLFGPNVKLDLNMKEVLNQNILGAVK